MDYAAEEIVSSPHRKTSDTSPYSVASQVHVERTAKLAAHLGQAALSNGGVKAYVRILGSEYQAKDAKTKVSVAFGHGLSFVGRTEAKRNIWDFGGKSRCLKTIRARGPGHESKNGFTKRAVHWHKSQSERTLHGWESTELTSAQSLNLVLVRPAALYGPYMVTQSTCIRTLPSEGRIF
jgi:hypothetical protein